eukprot:Skav213191  [mRNA]  locus=scaffold2826:127738:132486:+ [translate_table: standard]
MAMHLLTPEEAEIARAAQKKLLVWLSFEYESVERALRMFDLDADGMISAYEISRIAVQAGVSEHAIPTLIRSLRMGPAGMPLDSLADILLGRGVAVPAALRWQMSQPPPPPVPPPPLPPPTPRNRLLQVVEEATKRRSDLSAQILGLLQWQEVPEFPWQQREADAISWALRMGTHELFSTTDPFGSTALMLSCRLGMAQLCHIMLSAPGILPEVGMPHCHDPDPDVQLSTEMRSTITSTQEQHKNGLKISTTNATKKIINDSSSIKKQEPRAGCN